VIRGGAFNSFEPEHTDPALRLPYDADAHTHGIGFRCAADPRG
jgi:formylglycine-generating enzyme required for sulfatase activity